MSRFINHSCNPCCQLQKWVVKSRLRMGIFAVKDMPAGAELTFDYKFERYGYVIGEISFIFCLIFCPSCPTFRQEAQKCYCGEEVCKGVIGGERKSEYYENGKELVFTFLDVGTSFNLLQSSHLSFTTLDNGGDLNSGDAGSEDEEDSDEEEEVKEKKVYYCPPFHFHFPFAFP